MAKDDKDTPADIPQWDVALEALIREEFKRRGRPLSLDDFRRLGKAHRIRVHDITATVYQLERHGKWYHQARDGAGRPVQALRLAGLYRHERLDEDTAEKFSVTWAPRPPAAGK